MCPLNEPHNYVEKTLKKMRVRYLINNLIEYIKMIIYSGTYRIREGRIAIFGKARTLSRCAGTAFKAHKIHVKPVKNRVPAPFFPPDFQFPIFHSRSQILEYRQIYYLDRYSLSGKYYLSIWE